MKFLELPLWNSNEFINAMKELKTGSNIQLPGVSDSQKAHLSYLGLKYLGMKGIFIAPTEVSARNIYEEMTFFFKEEAIFYPFDEIVLHNVDVMSHDAAFERLSILHRLINNDYSVLVLSVSSLMRKLMPREKFMEYVIRVQNGSKIELNSMVEKLIYLGYERVEPIEAKGHFSVRGGIVDIYPVNFKSAIRVEFFDDEVDSIRKIDLDTQRSLERLDEFDIYPAREIVLNPEERKVLSEKILAAVSEKTVAQSVKEDISKINEECYFAGIDRYIPFMSEEFHSVLDYAKNSVLILDDPARMEHTIEVLDKENNEAFMNLLERGTLLPESTGVLWNGEEIISSMDKFLSIQLKTFQTPKKIQIPAKNHDLPSKSTPDYTGKVKMMIDDIKQLQKKDYRVVILGGPKTRAERLVEALNQEDINAIYFDEYEFEANPNFISVTHGSLSHGIEYPGLKFCIFSEKEIFGEEKKKKRGLVSKDKGRRIQVFTDLKIGDYVVHYSHGIGQYVGVEQLIINKIAKDFIKIRYHGKDNLYLPIDQMDLIQKYIGSEGKLPKLNKLGGVDWSKTRERVKESLKAMADELIRLYAQRESSQGYAFSQDTVWQSQMEELFQYQETEDQIRCIEEIKADMQHIRPMDRLLCGDVGFGKTEVAMRAVFKAVMDGKQVAYLVPTTVLAQQQYNSFIKRMKDFPVNIEVISRFRTRTEQTKILKELKAGNIDILIGTHRIIQKDITFKDIGLLVLDEEQRFGVAHKERIKQLKPNIDVLTLTATPIPRTLHMSLVGIRDISVIEEPPENRHPVETYIMEYDTDVVRNAITREMGRNGQVFYLYNNVKGIDIKAAQLMKIVPEAKIAIAHGQLEETKLEKVMQGFIDKEFDVLICSTIIESGLDLPNVNTMIVEDSDKLGLAQMYQIRGRVGRSNRIAYAYMMYKKDKVLSEIAEKRLKAIKEFTELGSGLKIAMRDLEIRGAGNLLGSQQHGHMDSVGYDMYVRLLDEAVKEMKGEKTSADIHQEVNMDFKINAFIDTNYIPSELVRLEIYKKIAAISNEEELQDLRDELVDRFGDIPEPTNNLISIAYIKALARECRIDAILQKESSVLLYPSDKSVDLPLTIQKLSEKFYKKIFFSATVKPYITFRNETEQAQEIIRNITILLQNFKKFQSLREVVYNER